MPMGLGMMMVDRFPASGDEATLSLYLASPPPYICGQTISFLVVANGTTVAPTGYVDLYDTISGTKFQAGFLTPSTSGTHSTINFPVQLASAPTTQTLGTQVLPVTTLNVVQTVGFNGNGTGITLHVGSQSITYSGTTNSSVFENTFTGCAGGTGTIFPGTIVTTNVAGTQNYNFQARYYPTLYTADGSGIVNNYPNVDSLAVPITIQPLNTSIQAFGAVTNQEGGFGINGYGTIFTQAILQSMVYGGTSTSGLYGQVTSYFTPNPNFSNWNNW